MKFERHKIYWCIAPDANWPEELPVVKPWQGKLYISKSDWGAAWYMHPVDPSPYKSISIHSEDNLFYTEEEARAVYIQAERNRLVEIMETVEKDYQALEEFANAK